MIARDCVVPRISTHTNLGTLPHPRTPTPWSSESQSFRSHPSASAGNTTLYFQTPTVPARPSPSPNAKIHVPPATGTAPSTRPCQLSSPRRMQRPRRVPATGAQVAAACLTRTEEATHSEPMCQEPPAFSHRDEDGRILVLYSLTWAHYRKQQVVCPVIPERAKWGPVVRIRLNLTLMNQ